MVKFLVANTRQKYLTVRKFYNTNDGVKFLNKLVHIPPQSRFVYVVMYDGFQYSAQSVIDTVEYLYSRQGLTKDILDKFSTYPIYNYSTKEVIRTCKTKN